MHTCPTCQRVKADHLPGRPAAPPTGSDASRRVYQPGVLDFLELPVARSSHDFLQVHRARVAGPVLQDRHSRDGSAQLRRVGVPRVGLPDVLVSDRETRFTSAFWTGLNAALGASLIYGSPYHHNTTSKVERVNGVIADVLHSFAGKRADDWQGLVPPVEFAIIDSAAPLGSRFLAQTACPSTRCRSCSS